MTVYLDSCWVLNFGVNYCLLSCAGMLNGAYTHRRRRVLAAALGAAYAVLALLPGFSALSHPVCTAAGAVVMLLTAFGCSERLLQTGALFLVLSCAFGGALLFAMTRGSTPWAGGILGPGLGLRGILVAAVLSYGGLSLLLRRQFRHTRPGGGLVPLTLSRGNHTVHVLALQDTGNTLQDPLTGRPVVILEGARARPLLPELTKEDWKSLSRPIELLRRLEGDRLGLQLLPYRAVGVEEGLLLALRVDRMVLDHQEIQGGLAALSPTPLSDGGSYSALVNAK